MKWSLMDSRWDYQWLKSIINGTIIDMYDDWWIPTIMVMIIGGLLILPLVVTTNHWRVVHWLSVSFEILAVIRVANIYL